MLSQERQTHKVWYDMMGRCYIPYHPAYARYGGEGIEVCKRWHDYDAFLADMGLKPAGTTLERRNNDGPYELANCKWATYAEQARNRRDTIMVTYEGRTMCAEDWAKELGVHPTTIARRIQRGLPIEDVLFQGNLRSRS